MTAVAFEHCAPVAGPARVVRARRPRLPLASAVQLPEFVPAWLMPTHHTDPLFAELASMTHPEVMMALLASDTDWRADRKATAPRKVEDYIELAMQGLARIGARACRQAAAQYLAAASHTNDLLWRNVSSSAPAGSPLAVLFDQVRLPADRRRAHSIAMIVTFDGFRHDTHRDPEQPTAHRCLTKGHCAHCYPERFTTPAAAGAA